MQQVQDQLSVMPAFMGLKLLSTVTRGAAPAIVVTLAALAGGTVYGAVKTGQSIKKYCEKTKPGSNKSSKLFRDVERQKLVYTSGKQKGQPIPLSELMSYYRVSAEDFKIFEKLARKAGMPMSPINLKDVGGPDTYEVMIYKKHDFVVQNVIKNIAEAKAVQWQKNEEIKNAQARNERRPVYHQNPPDYEAELKAGMAIPLGEAPVHEQSINQAAVTTLKEVHDNGIGSIVTGDKMSKEEKNQLKLVSRDADRVQTNVEHKARQDLNTLHLNMFKVGQAAKEARIEARDYNYDFIEASNPRDDNYNFNFIEVSKLEASKPPNNDYSFNFTPAKNLPEGWGWREWNDGRGSLVSPEGKEVVLYDYQTKEYSIDGECHFMGDSGFDRDYHERLARDKYVQAAEATNDKTLPNSSAHEYRKFDLPAADVKKIAHAGRELYKVFYSEIQRRESVGPNKGVHSIDEREKTFVLMNEKLKAAGYPVVFHYDASSKSAAATIVCETKDKDRLMEMTEAISQKLSSPEIKQEIVRSLGENTREADKHAMDMLLQPQSPETIGSGAAASELTDAASAMNLNKNDRRSNSTQPTAPPKR